MILSRNGLIPVESVAARVNDSAAAVMAERQARTQALCRLRLSKPALRNGNMDLRTVD